MQTKKHSSKFKTLTLTLAVASVINTNTVFADAAADATAIETMGTALKDFIKDYSSSYDPAEVGVVHKDWKSGNTIDLTKGTGQGTYKAKGNTAAATNKAIYNGTDLSKTRYDQLLIDAKAIDKGAALAKNVFGTFSVDEKKATVLNNLLTNLGDNSSTTTVQSFLTALTATGNSSVSDQAIDDTKVGNTHKLNQAIENFNNSLYKTGTNNLGWEEQNLDAFIAYAAAYTKNEAHNNTTGKDFVGSGDVAAADTNKYSALYNTVAKALANTANQAKLFKEKGLHKITTDKELEEVVNMTDGNLANAISLTTNSITVKNSIEAHFNKAKSATGDEQVKLYEKAIASLTPNVNNLGRGAAAPIVRAVNDLVDARMQILNNTGMSSGDEYENANVWLRATYINYDADAKDESNLGFTQRSTGFGLGVDQQLDDKFNMGLSYNYVKSNLNGKDDYMLKDDIKSHTFGVYLTMSHHGIFADGQINYVKNKIDGKRTIGDSSISTSDVTYKYGSNVLNAVIGFGYDFNFENNWFFKPKACVSLSNYRNDKHSETGGLDAAIDVNLANYASVEIGVQLFAGIDVIQDNYKLQPKIKLGFMYDLNDKGNKLSYNFMGSDIDIEGAKRDQANFNFGAGFGFIMNELTVDFGYDFRWSNNSKAHGFVAKVGYMY